MSKYSFYYDESERSRKISYTTISASNYYDNFITMIVGWTDGKADILQRHADFENRFRRRERAALGRKKLRFERIASTAAVRTRGDFWDNPKPFYSEKAEIIRPLPALSGKTDSETPSAYILSAFEIPG